MKRTSISLRLLAAICFCFIAASLSRTLAWSQQTDPLAGKWKMVSTSPDGSEVDWTLTIVHADGQYTATSATTEENPVQDFKVDGAKIHFRVSYQGNEYKIDLTRDGDSLTGTWSGNDQSGQTKGQKAPTS